MACKLSFLHSCPCLKGPIKTLWKWSFLSFTFQLRKKVKRSRSVPRKSTSFQERGKVLYFLDITVCNFIIAWLEKGDAIFFEDLGIWCYRCENREGKTNCWFWNFNQIFDNWAILANICLNREYAYLRQKSRDPILKTACPTFYCAMSLSDDVHSIQFLFAAWLEAIIFAKNQSMAYYFHSTGNCWLVDSFFVMSLWGRRALHKIPKGPFCC